MAVFSYIQTSKLISLLQTADPGKSMNVRVLDKRTLSLEDSAFQQVATINLGTERIAQVNGAPPEPIEVPKATRKRGEYQLHAFGNDITAYTLNELLSAGLLALEAKRPGTLQKLSKIKPKTKRIVAREPSLLFDSEGLSEKHSAKLSDGWWYGTNNSAQETEAWLRRACECAGVNWNSRDFRLAGQAT